MFFALRRLCHMTSFFAEIPWVDWGHTTHLPFLPSHEKWQGGHTTHLPFSPTIHHMTSFFTKFPCPKRHPMCFFPLKHKHNVRNMWACTWAICLPTAQLRDPSPFPSVMQCNSDPSQCTQDLLQIPCMPSSPLHVQPWILLPQVPNWRTCQKVCFHVWEEGFIWL